MTICVNDIEDGLTLNKNMIRLMNINYLILMT